MPALFETAGSKELTSKQEMCLKILNYSMLTFCVVLSLVSYGFLWFGHVRYANK